MMTLHLLRRISLPILALLCLLITGCEESPTTVGTGPTGFEKVSGILNDDQGYLVPGALVEAFDATNARLASDTSDEAGAFILTGLPKDLGGVNVRVTHSDFKPLESPVRSIISMAGGSEGVIMNLLGNDSCCARLIVAVTTTDNLPLPGVEVKVRRGRETVRVGVTNDAGLATFTNICNGEYNLRLAKKGYAVVERDGINIDGCDTTRLEFTMRKDGKDDRDSCCNGLLKIIPRDSLTNEVIVGAKVQIKRDGGNTRNETTGENGALFRELCKGTYSVRIAKEGKPAYRVIEFSITVGCDDSVTTERKMVRKEEEKDTCCDGKLTFIPRDSTRNNEVINGAMVKLWKGNKVVGTKKVENGSATFTDLCKGEYVAEITREGYKRQEFLLELACNERKEVTRYLAPEPKDSCCNGRLLVTVKDSTTNLVIANATVKLWKAGKLIATKQTSDNGSVVFEGLCKGDYGVDLIREGYKSREFLTELGCNQNLEVTKFLVKEKKDSNCCTAKFVFRTKDSTNGSYVAGVDVKIMRGNDLIAEGETNGDGKYIREAICGNATYTVTFSKQGFISRTITIRLTECRIVEETIWMNAD